MSYKTGSERSVANLPAAGRCDSHENRSWLNNKLFQAGSVGLYKCLPAWYKRVTKLLKVFRFIHSITKKF